MPEQKNALSNGLAGRGETPTGADNVATPPTDRRVSNEPQAADTASGEKRASRLAAETSLSSASFAGRRALVPDETADMPEANDASVGDQTGESAAKAAPATKTVAQVLGEIVWLMTQSPRHKNMPLADLEWLVMPPILLKQFRIFYSGEQPVGVALWALADENVINRVSNRERLSFTEWQSGSTISIVEIVAPFGKEKEIAEQVLR